MREVIGRHRADDNHEVVTVRSKGETCRYRKQPCAECPWRKDSPIGAFPAEAFRHSANSAYDMSSHTFACHMSGVKTPTTCAGFLLQGAAHNMSVRMHLIGGRIDPDQLRSDVPLYKSYREMAEANGVAPSDPALRPCRD